MQQETIRSLMRALIQFTRERALEYKTFTGACIVKNQQIICREITSIEKDSNPLAHAELKVIRKDLVKMSGSLAGCQLFTTQQPCPMCASAAIWSGIGTVYFGLPSNHQWYYPEAMQDFFTHAGVHCIGPILPEECQAIDDLLIAHGI